MANDFSSDTRCKALWRFENGALTADSKGTNTLTAVGAPAANTTTYQEGSASVELVRTSATVGDGFSITDANLAAGFPYKNGDTKKAITVCSRFYADAIPGVNDWRTVWAKQNYAGSKVSLLFQLYNNKMRFMVGYGTGQSNQFWDFHTPSASRWYHVAIAVNGVGSRNIKIIVYDYSNTTKYTYEFRADNDVRVSDAKWTIGTEDNSTPYVSYFDGKIDEVVVFDEFLADTDIDAIRAGTFSGTGVNQIEVSQNTAQVEWAATPQAEVARLFTQVEYDVGPSRINVTRLFAQVEYEPSVSTANIRQFPVPPTGRVLQSQANKRQFPIIR